MASDISRFSIANAEATARRVEREEPRPLLVDPGEPTPFPVDALGPLASAARAIEEHTRAPIAIAGQSVLAAAALAAQAHADVELPTTQRHSPLSLFFLTIAESGERKSAVDGLALKSVRRREAELNEAHREELQAFRANKVIYDAKVAAAERVLKKPNAKDGEKTGAEADLRALCEPPDPPLIPMLTCPDPTFEGYVKLTATGQPALGLFSDEGGSFIGGHGMKQDDRLKTASALCDLWGGEPIKRVRATDGVMTLFGRRLSIHLMAQSMVAWRLLGDEELANQGLLSRLLTTFPKSTMGTRYFKEPSDQARRDLASYDNTLWEVLTAPQPLRKGSQNELKPRRLSVSPAAANLAIAFSDHIEAQLGRDGELAPISGFANKAVEHACRLAGVIEIFADLDAAEISAERMEGAIELVQHYLAETMRLRDAASIPKHLIEAMRLWNWIQEKWTEPAIFPTPIYKNGPLRSLRNKAAAVAALSTLEDYNYVWRIEGGAEVEGKWRNDAWGISGREPIS